MERIGRLPDLELALGLRWERGTLDGRRPVCRSIKTLRPPFTETVTDDDVRAAALQYVRKISGFRTPAAHNAEAFDAAVDAVTEATRDLLGGLNVRGAAQASRS
jgi:hypothetical protein